MLVATIKTVRARIEKTAPGSLNENNTKATLIDPVLRALGWDTEDIEEVVHEYRTKSKDKPVDYALLVAREPKLFIEAKALGENLNDPRWANQIMGYAAVAGVEWIVLTDGNEYRVYNAHATVPVEQKLLRTVRLQDETSAAAEVLGLLARDQIQLNRIETLWRAHFVDRQVRAALERLFTIEEELFLVNHVLHSTKNLSAEEVRGSLRRCKATLDFPLSPDDLAAALPKPTGRSRKQQQAAASEASVDSSEPVTLEQLISSGILKPPVKLTKKYKGRDLEAKILSDGTVTCLGQKYTSLSQAGGAARAEVAGMGTDGKLPATNGWDFWKYRCPDGTLEPISAARDEYLARNGQSKSTA